MNDLRFELQPSSYLAILLTVMHVGAVIILICLSFAWWLKTTLFLACVISLLFQLRQHVWCQNKKAIINVWQTAETWFLQDKSGQVWTARLCGDSVCTLYLALLNFKLTHQKKRRSVVILPDSVDPNSFRHLQIFFKS